jgi:hypothetical protein
LSLLTNPSEPLHCLELDSDSVHEVDRGLDPEGEASEGRPRGPTAGSGSLIGS